MRIKAHAKINLGLSVLGKRPDGFHEVDTLLVRLELADTLDLNPTPEGVALEVLGADLGIPAEKNLVYRAATRYLRATQVTGGVTMKLHKVIPSAAGLGGGSADAGATLRALKALYPAAVDIVALAAELGSDVPFFAADASAARATGRGEVLELLKLPRLHVVLVRPGVGVSAAAGYQRVQEFTPPLEVARLQRALVTGEWPLPGCFNALEAGVAGLEPQVSACLCALKQTPLYNAMMSGSGSCCFALAATQRQAAAVAHELRVAHPEWWVCATHSL